MKGREAFPAFRQVVETKYKALTDRQAKAQIESVRLQQEAANGQQVDLTIADVMVKRYSGKATEKQDGFIQSLFTKSAGRGYPFTKRIQALTLSRTEASLMIDILLKLTKAPTPADGFQRVIDTDSLLSELKRISTYTDGSRQSIRVKASRVIMH